MKGGIRSNPTGDGFIAIVHKWDNVECRGEPAEWRHPQVFATEEEAMQYYKTRIRPALERFTTEQDVQEVGRCRVVLVPLLHVDLHLVLRVLNVGERDVPRDRLGSRETRARNESARPGRRSNPALVFG